MDINHGRGDNPRGQVISDEEWGDMGSLLSSRRPIGAKACDRSYCLVDHRVYVLPLGIGGLADGHRHSSPDAFLDVGLLGDALTQPTIYNGRTLCRSFGQNN